MSFNNLSEYYIKSNDTLRKANIVLTKENERLRSFIFELTDAKSDCPDSYKQIIRKEILKT